MSRLWSGRRRWMIVGLLLVAAMLAIQLAYLSSPQQLRLVTRLNNLVYDTRFGLLPPQRQAMLPIVIVDLDEFSIQREGRWPWGRSKVARLVSHIRAYGAVLIGMDIVFSEPGGNAVRAVLKGAQWSPGLAAELRQEKSTFNEDRTLARSLGRRTVLGYFFQNSGHSSGRLPFPFYRLPDAQRRRNTLLHMSDYTASLPVLANQAIGQGFVVAIPDVDGVVRRVPLVIQHGDGVYASLTLVMARLALGAHWTKLHWVDNGTAFVADRINIGDKVTIPVSANGSMLVPYRGHAGSFPTVSATRVLRGDLSAAEKKLLDRAIVLVGTSALGLSDLRTTPLQTAFPGVEIHANVLDTILQAALGENTFYYQPGWAPAASLLLLLLLGSILAVLLPGRSPLWMLVLAICWITLVLAGNAWLWQVKHWALPMALLLITVVIVASFNLVVGFVEASRNRRHVENLFGAYVPQAYVKRMLAQPETATMAGEQRDMTVLFADVTGFTRLSENLTTGELKHWLNRYLTEVTGIIFEHQGTIDKYVGDMVMAFWNAPIDEPMHAQKSVLTALAMQKRLVTLRDEFATDGLPPLHIGIGLNSGAMDVGDMGSVYRRAYTVLGDAVNLGSRLESLTRFYGVNILVSDATREQCGDVLFLPVDRIRVRGKHKPVDVFEPLCHMDDADEALRARVTQFEQALTAYRNRGFAEAQAILEQRVSLEAGRASGRERLYRCYLQRIAAFQAQPPPVDWDPVFVHGDK